MSTHARLDSPFYAGVTPSLSPPPSATSFPIAAPWTSRLKRGLDLALGMLLLVPVALLTLPLCALVMIDGGKPVYRHARIGRGGRKFHCYKIRSMTLDADTRLQALLDSDLLVREEWAERVKLKSDPRVTGLGRFLRRTSLDELPQLWNVLKGEMSLIGPRPITLGELEFYGEHAPAYLACTPGISGLWQVSGRNETTYEQRVALDVIYARDWSWALEARILLRTLPAVLGRRGSY